MSAEATAWVWRAIKAGRVKNTAARLTLLKLGDRADEVGKCWPGHERTASDCNLSERGTRLALFELERDGLVLIERRFDISGRSLSNVYRLPVSTTVGEGAPSAPPEAPAPITQNGEGAISSPPAAPSAPESNKTNLKEPLSACTTPPPTADAVRAEKTGMRFWLNPKGNPKIKPVSRKKRGGVCHQLTNLANSNGHIWRQV